MAKIGKKSSVTDMTVGSPLKHIVTFAVPLMIGNMFQVFYNMADALIVGRTIGVDALAAVGAAGAIMFFMLGFINGAASGFAIIVSQRFGAGDYDGVRRSVAMGTMLCVLASVMFTIIAVISARPLLELMNTPANIIDDTYNYIIVIYYGITPFLFYNYLSSIIRAVGDSKTPLYFLLVATILNVILDIVFITVFHMGVAGAGLATIIAQGISAILCVFVIIKKMPLLKPHKEDWKWNNRLAGRHLAMGIPMGVQNSIISMGSMVVQTVLNSFGSTVIAGFTAACKVDQFLVQPIMSFGVTMATYVGQNFGARNMARIKEGVKKCTIIVTVFCLAGSAVLVLFGRNISELFVGAGHVDIIETAQTYLNIEAMFFLILGYLLVYRSSLQGMGKSVVVMTGSILELGARVFFALVLGRGAMGYVGVCLAGPM
ncbi:MAG: MATE family efflux transporter, partial [Oscillospiraceae bacterium]